MRNCAAISLLSWISLQGICAIGLWYMHRLVPVAVFAEREREYSTRECWEIDRKLRSSPADKHRTHRRNAR